MMADDLMGNRIYPFAGIEMERNPRIIVRQGKAITGRDTYKMTFVDIKFCAGVIKVDKDSKISIEELNIKKFKIGECDDKDIFFGSKKDRFIEFMTILVSAFPNIKY